jgi:hypothetical protein
MYGEEDIVILVKECQLLIVMGEGHNHYDVTWV